LLQDLLAMGELQRNVDEAFMADIVGKWTVALPVGRIAAWWETDTNGTEGNEEVETWSADWMGKQDNEAWNVNGLGLFAFIQLF
jgi:hypothetical protein